MKIELGGNISIKSTSQSIATEDRMRLVESICNYIKLHPSANLTLPALEKIFSLNRFTLQKTFKELMGITPRKYVEECRINLLKKNLKEGEPIPRAVYSAGYNSHSWLYGSRASKLGMNPSSYRRGG